MSSRSSMNLSIIGMDSYGGGESKRSSMLSLESIRNKLFFNKKRSVNVTDYDPVYKVIYLGNVLTPWAKGDGCCDKPLSTLWKNYCSNVKHEIYMKLTICNSGLKAITREHGLTEYWSNRITYCCAHPNYPKVFCWIYRHEGRKLKQELRCHAVLMSKESKAIDAANQLSTRLVTALEEFRREKKMRQNTRMLLTRSSQIKLPIPSSLSTTDSESNTDSIDGSNLHHPHHRIPTNMLMSSCDSQTSTTSSMSSASSTTSSTSSKSTTSSRSGSPSSLTSRSSSSSTSDHYNSNNSFYRQRVGQNNYSLIPVRKKHLVKGQANFRPPIERSKSAPRLTSIDELQEDEITDLDDSSTSEEVEDGSEVNEDVIDINSIES